MKLINLENGKIINRKEINKKFIQEQLTIDGKIEYIYKQTYRIEDKQEQK